MPDTGIATGPQRIAEAFSNHGRRAALMPYLMGGFPDMDSSLGVGEAYAEAGADLVEVGVPFSDPLADGPAIQAAGHRALAAGATLDRVLAEVAAPLSEQVPVVLMCYANPILARGIDAVPELLARHRVSGLIVPDMPSAEAAELRAACDAAGVALVPLVAPTTPADDARRIAQAARGFVYVVSVTGVTGERATLPPELGEVVERVRAAAGVPVAVGFGVGTPAQAAEVGRIADGVIVGSRLVRAVADAPTLAAGLDDLRLFMAETADALSGG
ncbi:MAG: tryptophan synthase subunit alpha [Solirubrobacterales bacterium]